MEKESYTSSITANVTPSEAFNGICKVSEWWGSIEGETNKLNDVFTYRPGETWVNFKITEFIPQKKIVWHVTDCFLHWQNDKTEWKNTDVIFEIAEKNGSTTINFTHRGLVPGIECYDGCVKGWDQYFGGSLLKLLNSGVGQPK